MRRSYGLDLSGFSGGNSAIAQAKWRDDQLHVTILDSHWFAAEVPGNSSLERIVKRELGCLRSMFADGPVYVDVPIDLQGLPLPAATQYVWQLTERPVDRAFDALSPLADKIGSCVARMQKLWQLLGAHTETDPLGLSLFETYPAGTLFLSDQLHRGYKGHCRRVSGQWVPKRPKEKEDLKLATLVQNLNWQADNDFALSNDEFDAALCALAGVGDRVHGEPLDQWISNRLGGNYRSPKGYVLLQNVPSNVQLLRKNFGDVLEDLGMKELLDGVLEEGNLAID